MGKMRNVNIEMFRCLLMVGIVFFHCAQEIMGSGHWYTAICKWCVDGFALISGYCGIKQFRVSKVLRLYFVALFSLFLMEAIDCLSTGSGWDTNEIWNLFCSLWFLHAYVILMIIAPLINGVAESDNRFHLLLPFIFVILIWGLLCELPVIGKIMFRTSGIQSHSGLTLAAVYAVGCLFRVCNVQQRTSWTGMLLITVISMSAGFIGFHNFNTGRWNSGWFSNYSSPFCVGSAVGFLYFSNRIKVPESLGRLFMFMAPSIFPVYVIHQHPLYWNWMIATGKNYVNDYFPFIVLSIIACIIFSGSILVDLFRRGVMNFLSTMLSWNGGKK